MSVSAEEFLLGKSANKKALPMEIPKGSPEELLRPDEINDTSLAEEDAGNRPIDLSRPKIKNSDGSFSTEKTMGIEADGKYYNIPTIVGGKEVSPDEAVALFRQGINKPVGIYNSQEEADLAAPLRSKEIGKVRSYGSAESFLLEGTKPEEPSVEEPTPKDEPFSALAYLKDEATGIGKTVVGGAETLSTMATGLVGMIPAGLQGLGEKIYQAAGGNISNEEIAKHMEQVQNSWTDKPETEVGKAMIDTMSQGFNKGVDWAENRAIDKAYKLHKAAGASEKEAMEKSLTAGFETRTGLEYLMTVFPFMRLKGTRGATTRELPPTKPSAPTKQLELPMEYPPEQLKLPIKDPTEWEPGRTTDYGNLYERLYLKDGVEQLKPTQGQLPFDDLFDQMVLKIEPEPLPSELPIPEPVQLGFQEMLDQARSVGAAEVTKGKESSLGVFAEEVGQQTKRVYDRVINIVGGKSITPLREAAKKSPTLKEFVDQLEAPEVAEVATGATYWERLSRELGKRMTKIDDSFNSLRQGIRAKVKDSDNLSVVKGLRGEKVGAHLESTVKQIRQVLDETFRYLNDAGLKVKYLKDYFPRMYDLKVLKNSGDAFIKKLMEYKIDADEADLILTRIKNEEGFIDHLRLGDRPRVPRGVRDPNVESVRKLSMIPDKELQPFLINDALAVLPKYLEWATRRAEWSRVFGPRGEKLRKAEKNIRKELRDSAHNDPNVMGRISDIANAMQRTYHPIQSMGVRKAQKVAVAYQYARTMLRATISSATELYIPFIRGRFKSSGKALFRSMEHMARQTMRIAFKNVPEAEVTRYAKQAGLALEDAIQQRMVDTWGGEVSKFTTGFFKATGSTQFTTFNRVYAFQAGKYMIVDNLKDLSRGLKSKYLLKKYSREVTELGIDPKEGVDWVKRGADMADPFFEKIINGGIRFTNEVVMHPRVTNRPMWHSNPHYQLVTQLKGFQTAFGNTVVKRMLKDMTSRGPIENIHNTTKHLTVASLMVLTTMMLNDLWNNVKHGGKPPKALKKESTFVKVANAFDRTGFSGTVGFFYDSVMAPKYGSDPLAQLLGPQAAQAGDVMKSTFALTQGSPRPMAITAANAIPVVSQIPPARKAVADMIAKKRKRTD